MEVSVMKKYQRFFGEMLFMAFALLFNGCATTGKESTMQNQEMTAENGAMFGKGKENTAYAKYFIGKSYLNPMNDKEVFISNVTFEPGCRNNWHIHHKAGQILLVTAGRGWYQEWGKPAQELKPGDVVYIPPEVKHWHGAAKDSWFVHIAESVPVEGAATEWCEPVTNEEYTKLK
jgi:quercetin dioxygenase-like cupin family protein